MSDFFSPIKVFLLDLSDGPDKVMVDFYQWIRFRCNAYIDFIHFVRARGYQISRLARHFVIKLWRLVIGVVLISMSRDDFRICQSHPGTFR